jgi:hypothetical protein
VLRLCGEALWSSTSALASQASGKGETMFKTFQKKPSKRRSLPLILKVVAVIAALTATPMTASADIDAESGRLQITLVKTRYGGSSGILFYQGHKYGLAISGTQLKGIWITKIDLIGDALNLRTATDIVGAFTAGDGGDATLRHANTARLENPKGVILEIRGVNLKRNFTLNLLGMIIKNAGWETSSQ